ncbi:aminoglycoside 6-adenylyltransferase [Caldibacillus debilis]|uniref:aminoglycoside 6-adenylyltransferase n=1 Tax=Caldibacillus debilis TaxID=301148 RepID=UPI00035F559F|nr:aminoglycoside 6-adenylyltransferase [Caldibacillus debilis]
MNATNVKYEALIERIKDWAESQQDIRAVLIQGSYARQEKPADEWSDLDLTIVSTTPDIYISTTEWLQYLGKYWLTFVEKTSDGNEMERRVLFEDGLDVDFAVYSNTTIQQMIVHGLPEHAKYTLSKGIRILVDKDGIINQIVGIKIEKEEVEPPSQQEYLELVNDFLYHYIWTLKKLKRKELWTAKGCLDNYMKWKLLKLIEWHSRATKGWNYDTWHAGRFLEEWADPKVIQGLRGSFSHYDHDDILRALKETYKLFRWLAIEVAERQSFGFPFANEEMVLKWAEKNLC